MIRLTKQPILPNCQVPNGYSYFCICLQVVYICSAFGTTYFCVSFSCERKSEMIERKFKTQNPILSHTPERSHASSRTTSARSTTTTTSATSPCSSPDTRYVFITCFHESWIFYFELSFREKSIFLIQNNSYLYWLIGIL